MLIKIITQTIILVLLTCSASWSQNIFGSRELLYHTNRSKVIYLNSGIALGNFNSLDLGLTVEIKHNFLIHLGYSRMGSMSQTKPSDQQLLNISTYEKLTFRHPSYYDISNHYQLRVGKMFFPRLKIIEFFTLETGIGLMVSNGPVNWEERENRRGYNYELDSFNTYTLNLASMIKIAPIFLSRKIKFFPNLITGPNISLNKNKFFFAWGLHFIIGGYYPVRKTFGMVNR